MLKNNLLIHFKNYDGGYKMAIVFGYILKNDVTRFFKCSYLLCTGSYIFG